MSKKKRIILDFRSDFGIELSGCFQATGAAGVPSSPGHLTGPGSELCTAPAEPELGAQWGKKWDCKATGGACSLLLSLLVGTDTTRASVTSTLQSKAMHPAPKKPGQDFFQQSWNADCNGSRQQQGWRKARHRDPLTGG